MSDFDGKFKDYYWWPSVYFIFGSDDNGKTVQYHMPGGLGFSKGGTPSGCFSKLRQLQFNDLFRIDMFNHNHPLYIKEALKWLSKD